MRLLLINPNTTASVTARLAEAACALAPGVAVQAVTARFGAPYIACEASCAVAGHAVLDAWAAAAQPQAPDAVLIGCFGDPGLLALREVSAAPVTGLAEAAFTEAAAIAGPGGRFAIVTGGERWGPMLRRLAQGLGFGDALAAIHTVAPSGIELARDPDGAVALLAQACRQAAAEPGVQALILGGAGLVGLAARVQGQLALPVIDSVHAGIRQALALAAGPGPRPGLPPPGRCHTAWHGVAPELQALGG